jgi:acyl-ACP thioesterase
MEMNKPAVPASETLQTADLDNQGILQLQENAMRQQDAELEDLERTVTSTKVLTGPSPFSGNCRCSS